MKIRFESDVDLPLGKTFDILDMIIAVASVASFYMNAHIIYKNVTVRKN